MSTAADHLIDEYLERLNDELADLPRARRRELVREISEHIEAARADLPAQDEREIRELLERLGDPMDIAVEAHAGAEPATRPRVGAWEVAAIILLLVGGIFLPFVGWLVGVFLLWASSAWTSWEKLVGTLVVPGGLLGPVLLLVLGVSVESCTRVIDVTTGAVSSQSCTGGTSAAVQALWIAAFAALVIAPIASAVFLARRASRRAAAA